MTNSSSKGAQTAGFLPVYRFRVPPVIYDAPSKGQYLLKMEISSAKKNGGWQSVQKIRTRVWPGRTMMFDIALYGCLMFSSTCLSIHLLLLLLQHLHWCWGAAANPSCRWARAGLNPWTKRGHHRTTLKNGEDANSTQKGSGDGNQTHAGIFFPSK